MRGVVYKALLRICCKGNAAGLKLPHLCFFAESYCQPSFLPVGFYKFRQLC